MTPAVRLLVAFDLVVTEPGVCRNKEFAVETEFEMEDEEEEEEENLESETTLVCLILPCTDFCLQLEFSELFLQIFFGLFGF